MSQRALVTGATGLLGRQVVKAFERAGWEAVGTGFSRAEPPKIRKVDIQNEDEVVALLDEVKPHVVVHCAAERRPDAVTANPSAAHTLNVTATSTLSSLTSARAIFLIYISTDYVFAGAPGDAPYPATAAPSPTNTYGATKLAGEHAVLASPAGTAVVLRVPVLYGATAPRDNNAESAVNVLLDTLRAAQSRPVPVDDWAVRYPTNTEDVARVCVDVAAVYARARDPAGLPRVLQFSSEDRMTKYDICGVLAEVMDLPVDGVVRVEDGGGPAADGTVRPYDCHLSTEELRGLGVDVRTVDFKAWWRRYVGAFRR